MDSDSAAVRVAVYSGVVRSGEVTMDFAFIQELGRRNGGFETFLEETVAIYTCEDGLVLLLAGLSASKQKGLIGLSLSHDKLLNRPPEDSLRQLWEKYRPAHLQMKKVTDAILSAAVSQFLYTKTEN